MIARLQRLTGWQRLGLVGSGLYWLCALVWSWRSSMIETCQRAVGFLCVGGTRLEFWPGVFAKNVALSLLIYAIAAAVVWAIAGFKRRV